MDDKKIILIIDDDPLILGALSNILLTGYHVKVARDGATGLVLADKYDVDLIILDIVMKHMSGYEVLEKLRTNERTKNIPIIFITEREDRKEEIKALSSGAVDFIRKPIVPEVVNLRVGLHMKLIKQMRIIERFSLTDGLTGVNNRRCFNQQFESEWNRAARNGLPISLLMADIDCFKAFNDKHGHLNGDLALKTIASVLVKTVLRGTDYVFRWGGEEFAVILPETPVEGAAIVAEKIRQNIEATPIAIANETVYVTISIGASAIVPKPGTYPSGSSEFTESIDKALYSAKRNGRNRVELACVGLTCAKN
jgi:diguanylate cyclase (GGDEF)-like protein